MCINQMIASGQIRESQVAQYFHENDHLLRVTRPPENPSANPLSDDSPSDDSSSDNEDDDDDDDEEEDEGELAATLLQLMRDNARLEALNASYIEKIIAERDSCAHLKVIGTLSS